MAITLYWTKPEQTSCGCGCPCEVSNLSGASCVPMRLERLTRLPEFLAAVDRRIVSRSAAQALARLM